MKIAVVAGFLTKRYMKVNSGHPLVLNFFIGRPWVILNANLPKPGQCQS
jgi:hypothetical protein